METKNRTGKENKRGVGGEVGNVVQLLGVGVLGWSWGHGR